MRKATKETMIEIKEEVRIPGTDIILEAGDRINIITEANAVDNAISYLIDDDGLDELPDEADDVDEALDVLVDMFAVQGQDRDKIRSNKKLIKILVDSGRFK